MAIRWVLGVVSGLALVVGLVFQVFALAIGGLVGLLGSVAVVSPGRNPLAETYRDVRPFDRI